MHDREEVAIRKFSEIRQISVPQIYSHRYSAMLPILLSCQSR
jgi:hypothetical protein